MASVYEIVTDRIIQQLEQGTAPWHKPWATGGQTPANLVSLKPYRGINVWLLSMMPYQSPYWVTFKQAGNLGGSVKKGEKATPIVYYSKKLAPAKAPGEIERELWILRYYSVFNTEQCENLTVPAPVLRPDTFVPIDAARAIVDGMPSRPEIQHGQQGAWYRPSADLVGMPDPVNFETPDNYYSTLFHELVHATGHFSRLDRAEVNKTAHFGSADYSREELVAELGAAYLCAQSGITSTIEQSASYLKSWITALRGDARLIVHAASAAQRAAEYIRPGGEPEPESGPADTDIVTE